jgi:hypothetical protein
MCDVLRVRHYRYHAVQTYLDRGRLFILFHSKRFSAALARPRLGPL